MSDDDDDDDDEWWTMKDRRMNEEWRNDESWMINDEYVSDNHEAKGDLDIAVGVAGAAAIVCTGDKRRLLSSA